MRYLPIKIMNETAQMVAELYKHHSAHDIALMMRCSESTVRKMLHLSGVKIRTQSEALLMRKAKKYPRFRDDTCRWYYSMAMVTRIMEMYKNGHSIMEIGLDIGRSAPTVAKLMRMYNISVERRVYDGKAPVRLRDVDNRRVFETEDDIRERCKSKGIVYENAYADNIDEKTDDAERCEVIPRWIQRVKSGYSSDSIGASSLCGFTSW